MTESKARARAEDVARYADMFAAIGTEARLRILTPASDPFDA